MATTLTEYRYGGNAAELKKEIAEVLVNESPLLAVLGFDELTDNNVSRQRMYLDDGDIVEHNVNGTWNVTNPHWEFRDAPLAVMGDNVTVDNFGALSSGASQEKLMAGNVMEKSGQISRTFDKLAVYAATTSVARLSGSAMVGLLIHIARTETSTTADLDGWLYTGTDGSAHNTQVVDCASSAGATLTLGMLQRAVDAVRPKCTHIMLSRLMRSKLQTLAQASGTNLDVQEQRLGQIVTRWGEQVVLVNDAIKDNAPDPSSDVTTISTYDYDSGTGDTSPIFCLNISPNGFTGINGKGMIQVENLAGGGAMESLDAKGKRIKAYIGVALRHRRAAAVLCGATYT